MVKDYLSTKPGQLHARTALWAASGGQAETTSRDRSKTQAALSNYHASTRRGTAGAQRIRSMLQGLGAQPSVGHRYHVHPNRAGLAVLGGDRGSVFATSSRLVDG